MKVVVNRRDSVPPAPKRKRRSKWPVALAALLGVLFGAQLPGLANSTVLDPRERLWSRAEEGDVQAMLDLAKDLREQSPVNPFAAVAWYERAAAAGEPQAMLRLGDLHAAGEGVHPNHVEATAWWTRAADLGQPEAMLRLAQQSPVVQLDPWTTHASGNVYGDSTPELWTDFYVCHLQNGNVRLETPQDAWRAKADAIYLERARNGDHDAANRLRRLRLGVR